MFPLLRNGQIPPFCRNDTFNDLSLIVGSPYALNCAASGRLYTLSHPTPSAVFPASAGPVPARGCETIWLGKEKPQARATARRTVAHWHLGGRCVPQQSSNEISGEGET